MASLPRDRELSERMAAAARDLQGVTDPEETYRSAAALALANVEGCQFAGLSIIRARHDVRTLAATDPVVSACDQLQYELDEGPCLDAMWEETTVHSPSLAYDERWPTWGPRVVEETGIHSVLAFQLYTKDNTLGALNLFSRQRDAFDERDRTDGLALAAHIAIAVTAAEEVDGLDRALQSRTVISQATGILIERYHLKPAVAFALLSRISSTEAIKIRDLAEHLVETGELGAGSPPTS